jgi:hypothetical protein
MTTLDLTTLSPTSLRLLLAWVATDEQEKLRRYLKTRDDEEGL